MFKKKETITENEFDLKMREKLDWLIELRIQIYGRVKKVQALNDLQTVYVPDSDMARRVKGLLSTERQGLENCCAEYDNARQEMLNYYQQNRESFTHDWAAASMPDSFETVYKFVKEK